MVPALGVPLGAGPATDDLVDSLHPVIEDRIQSPSRCERRQEPGTARARWFGLGRTGTELSAGGLSACIALRAEDLLPVEPPVLNEDVGCGVPGFDAASHIYPWHVRLQGGWIYRGDSRSGIDVNS